MLNLGIFSAGGSMKSRKKCLVGGRNFYRGGKGNSVARIGWRLALGEACGERGAQDESHEIPGNEGGEHDVDTTEEASFVGAPAVDAEHDGGDFDHHETGDGRWGKVDGEAHDGIAFLHALHQEGDRGEEVEQLQIAIVDEDGRQSVVSFPR